MTERTADVRAVDAGDYPAAAPMAQRAKFLLRYAILAPSSHNSQPWSFQIDGGCVLVRADLDRWLRVADADKRELYVSLGCAVENLVLAAERFGLDAAVTYPTDERDPTLAVRVELEEGGERASASSDLFDAIVLRSTNRTEYDGRPVPEEQLRELASVAAEPGIRAHFSSDLEVRQRVDELVVRADAMQFADPEWRRELGVWVGAGLLGTGWLLSKASQLAVTYLDLGKSTAKSDRALLRSAPTLGLVAAPDERPETRIRAGRAFERLFLAATHRGLALHPMNQILQVPAVRDDFIGLLPEDWGVPQITFRMGHAEADDPRSPRRPVAEVLAAEGAVGGPSVSTPPAA